MMPTVTGHIMAVAAALLIHMEMRATASPTAAATAVVPKGDWRPIHQVFARARLAAGAPSSRPP